MLDTLSQAAGSFKSSDGLGSGRGVISTHTNFPVDLQSLLFDGPSSVSGTIPTRIVKATLGYMLFNETDDKKPNLGPDFSGYHSFRNIQDWIVENDVRTLFLPSLPYSLTNSLPSEQRILHRLVYQAVPSSDESKNAVDQATVLPAVHYMTLEILLAEPTASPSSSSTLNREGNGTGFLTTPQLVHGIQRKVDVMLPDRFMDVRFTVTDSAPVQGEQWPSELQAYQGELLKFVNGDENATQPDPPLILRHDGMEFVLHDTSSIRQSMESPPLDEHSPGTGAKIVTESVLDLENNQKVTQCEVTCSGDSPDAWLHFLDVCNILSSSSYKRRIDSAITAA